MNIVLFIFYEFYYIINFEIFGMFDRENNRMSKYNKIINSIRYIFVSHNISLFIAFYFMSVNFVRLTVRNNKMGRETCIYWSLFQDSTSALFFWKHYWNEHQAYNLFVTLVCHSTIDKFTFHIKIHDSIYSSIWNKIFF